MPMLIDTHCHLYLDRFHSDLDAVLDRALAAGVGEIYLPAVDRASVDDIFRLADRTGAGPGRGLVWVPRKPPSGSPP